MWTTTYLPRPLPSEFLTSHHYLLTLLQNLRHLQLLFSLPSPTSFQVWQIQLLLQSISSFDLEGQCPGLGPYFLSLLKQPLLPVSSIFPPNSLYDHHNIHPSKAQSESHQSSFQTIFNYSSWLWIKDILLSWAFKTSVISSSSSKSTQSPTYTHISTTWSNFPSLLQTSLYIWLSPCTQLNLLKSHPSSRVCASHCFLKETSLHLPNYMWSSTSLNLTHFSWLFYDLLSTLLIYLLYHSLLLINTY